MHRYFDRYSHFEDERIEDFRRHPLWKKFATMDNLHFQTLLLQLGHLSENFVPWCERAKLGLESEVGKDILRKILRDEIPGNAPTHQDDRLADLGQIGLSKAIILQNKPTPKTKQALRRLWSLIKYPQPDYDLCTLLAVRIAGEILVAETYRYLMPELTSRFGLKVVDSRFYYPHLRADKKGEGDHAQAFDGLLGLLIFDENTLEAAEEAATRAFAARRGFYDQFLH